MKSRTFSEPAGERSRHIIFTFLDYSNIVESEQNQARDGRISSNVNPLFPTQTLGIGMFMAALSCLVAAIVQQFKRRPNLEPSTLELYMPQFFLMGLAEIFANVAGKSRESIDQRRRILWKRRRTKLSLVYLKSYCNCTLFSVTNRTCPRH